MTRAQFNWVRLAANSCCRGRYACRRFRLVRGEDRPEVLRAIGNVRCRCSTHLQAAGIECQHGCRLKGGATKSNPQRDKQHENPTLIAAANSFWRRLPRLSIVHRHKPIEDAAKAAANAPVKILAFQKDDISKLGN